MTEKSRKPHFQVAAGLVWKEGKVLISKRKMSAHLGGLWEFPGGKQEQGESLEECLERELEEELGLKTKANSPLLRVHHEYESKRITLHVFSCLLLSGEARAMEGQEIRWVDPADLTEFAFPPPDLKVIEFLNRGTGSSGRVQR